MKNFLRIIAIAIVGSVAFSSCAEKDINDLNVEPTEIRADGTIGQGSGGGHNPPPPSFVD